MKTIGIKVYALAMIGFGLLGLASGDFAAVWQPVPDTLPGRMILAYIVAAIFLAGGIALFVQRTAATAALVLAVLFGLDVLLLHAWLVPLHPTVVQAYAGVAEQLALVCGAVIAYGRAVPVARGVFGLCLLAFGAAHFAYLPQTAAYVPGYLPPSQMFWAYATGIAHVAAGLAILSGVLARLASILLTIMFAGFSLLVHLPNLIGTPSHFNWAANAMNLALVGTAWIVMDSYAPRDQVTPPSTTIVEPTT
jgi:uncharacterized membrane protein YphA (DoxX/SURF4 family)